MSREWSITQISSPMQLLIVGLPVFCCSAPTSYISLLPIIPEQTDYLVIYHPRMILCKKMTLRIGWIGCIPFLFPCWMITSLYLVVLLMSLDIWPLPCIHICIHTHSTPSLSSSPLTQIQLKKIWSYLILLKQLQRIPRLTLSMISFNLALILLIFLTPTTPFSSILPPASSFSMDTCTTANHMVDTS